MIWTIAGIIISVFFGIFGVIGLIYTIMATKQKKLKYSIQTKPIKYKDPPVNRILTSVTIYNGGNDTIEQSDFATLDPLSITFSSKGEISYAMGMDKDYIFSSDKYINPSIEIINKNSIVLKFEYLKPKQYMRVNFLHINNDYINVSGTLKSGEIIYTKKPINIAWDAGKNMFYVDTKAHVTKPKRRRRRPIAAAPIFTTLSFVLFLFVLLATVLQFLYG